MIKRGLVFSLLLLVSIFSVNAAVIDINTLPERDVWITAKHPVNQEVIMSPMQFSSNENGSLVITYEIYESFTLFVLVKDGNNLEVALKETEIYDRDDYIELDIFPEGYVPPVREPAVQFEVKNETINKTNETNETVNETYTVENESSENKTSLSLPSISFDINYIYYAVVGLLALFLIILLFKKKKISKKIKCIDKKIKNKEAKIEKLKQKKKKLLLKAKEEMIKREEALIKFRGGSVPEKKEDKSLLEKLKESMKKSKNDSTEKSKD